MRNIVLLFFTIFPMIAYATDAVGEITDTKSVLLWGVNILLTLLLAVIAFQWRGHLNDYGKHKETVYLKFDGMKEEIAKALQKEEFLRTQLGIHQSIDSLRADVNRFRLEDSTALARVIAEVYDDVRDHRAENRKRNEEIWKLLEDTRDKMNNHQIALAKYYHTKEEIADMLDDKLSPVLNILRDIQNPAYGGPRKGV